jgi:aspartyl-tRNA synthetase
MHRSHTCGQLTAHHIGQTITLAGWVANRRDHGGIIFIDIRDKYGITQLVFDPQTHVEAAKIIESARAEWVIKIEGEVRARPSGQENSDLITGAIEIAVSACSIISRAKTPPFEISDHSASSEDIRYKYRYLDLRRDVQRKKIEFRATVNTYAREWFREK